MPEGWGGWLRAGLTVAVSVLALAYLVLAGRPAPETARAPRETGSAMGPRALPERPQGDRTLRIGWTAWADAELMTELVARIVEERLGVPVERVMADIGIQYQGVASGELDVMLMAWLPRSHASYWTRYGPRVVNLGPIYTRARLGWAVPAYVPEAQLASIADLNRPDVRARLNGRIQGIDPGSGIMQASERMMRAYGLEGYELVASSGAAMTAALARAYARDEWIVVTAWNPHWMFARWDLRYLEEPRGILGTRERVHAIVRRGLYEDFPPEVTEFLARLYVPLEALEGMLLAARERSVEAAVAGFIEGNPARVDYWTEGGVRSISAK